jgi:23S rRNA pseudouridine1911/1915/1917 synthase
LSVIEILITPESVGRRLDRVLRDNVPDISRTVLQKVVAAGNCLVNGRVETRQDVKIRYGQRVVIQLPETQTVLMPEAGEVDILWNDEHLLVCNKQAGLTVHPCPSCPENTLVQRLLARFPQLAGLDSIRPGIVHRLDKNTSGLLLAALDEPTRLALSTAFARREIHKEYLALVSGFPPEQGRCSVPIGRHPTVKIKMASLSERHGGKSALTSWRRLWSTPDKNVSLLAVRIKTGRTHQIRVHLAYLGHPLLGDRLYAPKPVQELSPRQMLHAWRLDFVHPHTGETLRFACPPPEDVSEAALAACRRMQRLVIVGNPGSGKSAILRQFIAKGFPVISADDIVSDMYARGGEAAQWLQQRFGGNMLAADGAVNKAVLFEAMTADPDFCRKLEEFVHPCVREAVKDFWRRQEESGNALAVAEVPLYFECGWGNFFAPAPLVVGVQCSFPERLRRTASQRGWTEKKAIMLESRQWPECRKMAACNMVLDNSGTPEDIGHLAEDLLEYIDRHVESRACAELEKLESLWSEVRCEGKSC